MTEPLVDTPTSPPASPVIPVGLATRIQAVVGSLFFLIALISAVAKGDHSEQTITALVLAALSFFVLAGGRYAQAALAELAKRW